MAGGGGELLAKHFIVLVGCKDGKIKVNDPYSYANSEKLWEFEVLQPQIKNLWKMSKYETDEANLFEKHVFLE